MHLFLSWLPWVIISGIGISISSRRRQAQARDRQRSLHQSELSVVDQMTGTSFEIPPDIVALVERGRKIQAIKRYRKLHEGLGLKEAKDIIDQFG